MNNEVGNELRLMREQGNIIVDFTRNINNMKKEISELKRLLEEKEEECELAWKIVAWQVYEHGTFVIEESKLADTKAPKIILEENLSNETIIKAEKSKC